MKLALIHKTHRVIDSCQTLAQAVVADRYVHLANRYLSKREYELMQGRSISNLQKHLQ